MSSEEKEGYDAYYKGKSIGSNPYDCGNQNWWEIDAWRKGWKQAQKDDDDDD